MKVMKAKDVHIALKRNDSISYLMERFDFSDKDTLFDAIRKVSPSGADDLIGKLEKKQKLIERRERNNTCTEGTGTEEIEYDEQPVQESEEDGDIEIVEEAVEEDDIEQEEENMQKLPDIEQLKAQETELSAMLCSLEGRHKEFVAKRRESLALLEKAQKAFKELLRILDEQERNVNKLYNEYQACANEMESINEERRSCEALLKEVRGQIADLKKVTILVYQNGKIEVENAEIPSISEEDVATEFNKLVSMPEAEEVKVKELKTIAKLLLMVKVYQANNCPYELEFDSTEVQRFWETVTA